MNMYSHFQDVLDNEDALILKALFVAQTMVGAFTEPSPEQREALALITQALATQKRHMRHD